MTAPRLLAAKEKLAGLGLKETNGIWTPVNRVVDPRRKPMERKWVPVGQGDFVKWETTGQEIEGAWRGHRDGQFGPLGTVVTDDGALVSFPLHTALLQRVDGIAKGTFLKIRYNGKKKNKEGTREYKDFAVWMAPEESPVQRSDRDEPAQAPDDDVPF